MPIWYSKLVDKEAAPVVTFDCVEFENDVKADPIKNQY